MCLSVDPLRGIHGQVFGDCVHVMHISCSVGYMLHVPLYIDGFSGYISLVIAP